MIIVPPTRISVATLGAEQIDRLVDENVFRRSRWCSGELIEIGMHEHCCAECSALVNVTLAMRIFCERRHLRVTPRYSSDMHDAWLIVDELRTRHALEVQERFAEALDNSARNKVVPVSHDPTHRLIFSLSPRSLAVAALRALGVIDASGVVCEVAHDE